MFEKEKNSNMYDMKKVTIKSLLVQQTTCISYIFGGKSFLCKDILIPAQIFPSRLLDIQVMDSLTCLFKNTTLS